MSNIVIYYSENIFLPSEGISVSNKFFTPRRYNSNKSTNYMRKFLKFIT